MIGKLIRRLVSMLCTVIIVQCSQDPVRVCNKCSKLVFNVKWGLENSILDDGGELQNMTIRSDAECFAECSFDCRCMSFSVCGDTCHLNAGSRNLVRGSLFYKSGCRYYDFPAFEVGRFTNFKIYAEIIYLTFG